MLKCASSSSVVLGITRLTTFSVSNSPFELNLFIAIAPAKIDIGQKSTANAKLIEPTTNARTENNSPKGLLE